MIIKAFGRAEPLCRPELTLTILFHPRGVVHYPRMNATETTVGRRDTMAKLPPETQATVATFSESDIARSEISHKLNVQNAMTRSPRPLCESSARMGNKSVLCRLKKHWRKHKQPVWIW